MSFTLQKHVSHLVGVVVGQLLYLSSLRVILRSCKEASCEVSLNLAFICS